MTEGRQRAFAYEIFTVTAVLSGVWLSAALYAGYTIAVHNGVTPWTAMLVAAVAAIPASMLVAWGLLRGLRYLWQRKITHSNPMAMQAYTAVEAFLRGFREG